MTAYGRREGGCAQLAAAAAGQAQQLVTPVGGCGMGGEQGIARARVVAAGHAHLAQEVVPDQGRLRAVVACPLHQGHAQSVGTRFLIAGEREHAGRDPQIGHHAGHAKKANELGRRGAAAGIA